MIQTCCRYPLTNISTAITPAHTNAAASEIHASTVSHVGTMREP
jgi:hypothetical protein